MADERATVEKSSSLLPEKTHKGSLLQLIQKVVDSLILKKERRPFLERIVEKASIESNSARMQHKVHLRPSQTKISP